MKKALHILPRSFPASTNAIAVIKEILHNNEAIAANEENIDNTTKPPTSRVRRVDSILIARAAARALGEYHATASDADVEIIFKQLISSHITDTAMDGLKALRGMKAPQAVPMLLPLLKDGNEHVLRDTIRTLAVLGDESTIPYIKPFLHNNRIRVVGDAQEAIEALKAKAKLKK